MWVSALPRKMTSLRQSESIIVL